MQHRHGAALSDQKASGTMPHALMLIYGDTVAAARVFDTHMPDFRAAYCTGRYISRRSRRKRARRARDGRAVVGRPPGYPFGIRWVTPDLVWRVRRALDSAGFDYVGIFVSGGLTPERISEFVRLECPIAGFGVGSAISGASPIDFTADIKEIDGKPIAKRGRKVGIQDNPRLKKN